MSQVRVSENTHQLLRSLSTKEGKPMQDIIEQAIDDYRRKAFLEALSNDFRLLRSDEQAWQEHQEETAVWDEVLRDGLDNQ